MWIACRGPGIRPAGKARNLLRGQQRVIGKVPNPGISKPGWHGTLACHSLNCARIWAHLAIGHQRHGSDFAASMADLAMLLVIGFGVPVAGRIRAQSGDRQNKHNCQETDVYSLSHTEANKPPRVILSLMLLK